MQKHRANEDFYVPSQARPTGTRNDRHLGISIMPLVTTANTKKVSKTHKGSSGDGREEKKKKKYSSSSSKKKGSHEFPRAPFPLLQLPRVELSCRNPPYTFDRCRSQRPDCNVGSNLVLTPIGFPPEGQSYKSRVSTAASSNSTCLPLASDTNTTNTTLTARSSSIGSVIQSDMKSKSQGTRGFYPGGSGTGYPPPPRDVGAALNTYQWSADPTFPGSGYESMHLPKHVRPGSNLLMDCRRQSRIHIDEEDPIDKEMWDNPYNSFWHFNTNFQSRLKRDHSVHSYGGFTLNGQPGHNSPKKRCKQFCSSHKVALVVSTFSLLVTLGLVITLLLMKRKGMMEAMR